VKIISISREQATVTNMIPSTKIEHKYRLSDYSDPKQDKCCGDLGQHQATHILTISPTQPQQVTSQEFGSSYHPQTSICNTNCASQYKSIHKVL